MKSLPAFLLLALSVLAFSCEGDVPEPEKNFTVQIDEVTWADDPNIFLNVNKDTLHVVASDLDRHVSLKVKFTGAGEYGPDAFRGTYQDVVGGDVFVTEYTVAGDAGATFTINEYNSDTKYIKGVFSFTARKIQGSSNYKETLVFSKGAFKGTVLNRNWF